MIRDPNRISASDYPALGPLMPKDLKDTIKKQTTANPAKQSTKDLSPTSRFLKTAAPQKPAADYKPSFEKRAEARDWKPLDKSLPSKDKLAAVGKALGAIDFTGKGMVSGAAKTKNFRFRLGKQVESAIGKSFY